jgi:CzcA family heavy metal efflux pump
MIRGIVGWALQFRFLVVVVAVALVAFGVGQLRNMPVDVLPEFSPPFVEIQTEALGLSAEEVEQMITVPMEQDLIAGVAWLDVMRSESVPGLSSVLIFFEPGTDLFRARQMVSERLAQAAVGLPHVSKPPTMIQPHSSASRFMIIGLSSKDISLIDMSVLARWVIAPRLLSVPGVSNVAVWGNRDRQLQVLVDPKTLQDRDVSLQQIVETTGNALWVSSLTYLEASSPGTGGFIDTPNQRLGIWHVLPISSPDDLAQIPIDEASPLRLGDVARVVEDHQPLIGDAIINDSPSLLLVVEKLPGVNTLEVTRGVEEAIDALRPGMKGIEFDATLFRPATYIEMALSNLTNALVVAAVLVVVALFVFLWNWRAALIAALVIPLSLMASLLVLYQRGATLNAMVLAGLAVAIGVIIDDVIVDVDHIVRRLRQRRKEGTDSPNSDQASTKRIILEASVEMRGSMIFAMLILLLVVLPIFFMEGMSGALLQPLVTSYALAVLVSMVVALLVTPALSMIFLSSMNSGALERRQSPLIRGLQRGYGRVLALSIKRARLVYIAVAIIIVAGIAALPFLSQQSLLPAFKESYLMIQLEGSPGMSRPAMDRIVARISSELRTISGIRNVGGHVGRAVFGDQVVGINSAQLWVSIDPAANYDTTVAAVQETVDGYTGLEREVQTYVQQTLSQPLASAGDGITVRVFGENLDVLRSEADKVRQAVSGIAGVVDPHVILPLEEPTLEIEVNLASAQTHGIKPGDVRRVAAILLSGLQVGSLFQEQKVFDVVVWGVPEIRNSLSDIRELLVETPSGDQVRLGDVADVRVTSAPVVIHREGISPYLDVAFNVGGRDVGAVANDVATALKSIPFTLEYHAEVLGGYAAQQAANQRLLLTGAIMVAGVFLLLQAAYRSWRLAFVAVLTMPVALAGGVLAALFSGGILSAGSLFGFLTVLGIAVRNGIAMTSQFQRLEQHDSETFGPELVLRGARERLAPILTTAFTTALAFVPFVLFGDIAGVEMVRPMAIVILGGLVTTTLLSLFVLPTLYLRFGANPEPVMEFSPEPAAVS